MARLKKRGVSGQARNFITRTQAVRKLQISLPDFRRLCIFKGIYPREPRKKRKASKSSTTSTTFYYTKDIQYLLHEPLLRKFRDHKALSKKIARHLGRGEVGDAARLEKVGLKKASLDHIVKERYPTFVDSLRDLDDALSLLFLFANLPSTTTVPSKTVALCQRLCHEFQHYLIATHSLRKSFLSIKGIYYQATIQGQDIFWLVPHRFVQRVPDDVDFRIMGTFVEFYTTLLGFVNYRLYNGVGLVYPPRFDVKSDERGGELNAFLLEGRGVEEQKTLSGGERDEQEALPEKLASPQKSLQARADEAESSLVELDEAEQSLISSAQIEPESIDIFKPVGSGADDLPQPASGAHEASTLFASFTFFLSRETPRQPLEFLLRSFGCRRIGWDPVLGDGAYTEDEADTKITHQVVDRPNIPGLSVQGAADITSTGQIASTSRVPGRIYVQPQWVWDCVNEGKLISSHPYIPGATLPPHLSPWVKPTKGQYDPLAPLEEDNEKAGEDSNDSIVSEEEDEDERVADLKKSLQDTDLDVDGEDALGPNEELKEVESRRAKGSKRKSKASDPSDGKTEMSQNSSEASEESDQFEEQKEPNVPQESEDGEDEEAIYQAELEAEAAGRSFANGKTKNEKRQVPKTRSADRQDTETRKRTMEKRRKEEELERRAGMLSKKQRKLYEKMMYSNRQKEEEAENLKRKRRKIEKRKNDGRIWN